LRRSSARAVQIGFAAVVYKPRRLCRDNPVGIGSRELVDSLTSHSQAGFLSIGAKRCCIVTETLDQLRLSTSSLLHGNDKFDSRSESEVDSPSDFSWVLRSNFRQVTHRSLINSLTPSQFRTAILVAQGLTNEEIGNFLGTTSDVIYDYVHCLLDEVGCRNRLELAIRFAHERCEGRYDSWYYFVHLQFLSRRIKELGIGSMIPQPAESSQHQGI